MTEEIKIQIEAILFRNGVCQLDLKNLMNLIDESNNTMSNCKECDSDNIHYTCSDCGFLEQL